MKDIFKEHKEAEVNREMIKRMILPVLIGMIVMVDACGSFADVVVVVNPSNKVTALKKSVVMRYFFKKSTMWDNGMQVVPVDLTATNAVREEFSSSVLGSSTKKVEGHWISESLTGGKSAPEIVSSPSLVKKRVAAEPGGIGYMDRAEVDSSVKVVDVAD